ncbi:MAG: ATP-binding cassette domain-containing protein, partial [Exilispira sp.]
MSEDIKIIQCKNLFFGYSKNLLFNNLNSYFSQGHIYGLLGKNGAGKTTLLKCIAGLLHPDKGEVEIYGKKSIKKEPSILKEIFFYPENFYLPSLDGKKYCELYSPFYPDFDKDYFLKTCDSFEIPLNKNLSTFSFGQKKKFYLAFGLSTFAKIMLLDEPTNGLDIPSKSAVRKKLAESLNENQIFIISTHQVRDLSQIFDSIIILAEGRIIFNNSID